MRAITKIRRSVRAISPVLSVLMMIAIAVAASLIAYAWIMGYIGGTTTKAGKAIQIQSMAKNEEGNLLVYVQNVGQGTVTIDSVYVDDVLKSFDPDPDFADNKLTEGKTAELTVYYEVPESGRIKVKVVTTDGTFTESSAISSGQGSSGTLNIPPTAAFSFSPADPETDETVTFTDASTDSDGTIVSWAWTFGDGDTSPLQNPTHSYSSANTYTVRLTVTDDDGATDYVEHTVPVALPAAFLDRFEFDTIGSQTTGVSFGITITAKDQYDATFSYSGSGTLSDLTGTITPTGVTFTDGVATSSVTITTAQTADTITVNGGGKSGTSNAFDVSNAPAVLTSFEFNAISSPQTAGTPFSITITAKDQYGATFTSYTGTNTLTYSAGSISPTTTTGGFTAGVWTGDVTVTGSGTGVTISTAAQSDPSKTGTSDSFNVNAGSGTFGYTTQGFSTSNLDSIRGSRFTCPSAGTATSISAYLQYTGASMSFGNTNWGSSGHSIEDTIRGQQFTSPSSAVVAQSITAYIYCSSAAKNMKAAIYDSSGNKVAETDEISVPYDNSWAQWQTFTFTSPPTLAASTQYVLVVWSQSGGGNAELRYSMGGGSGRYATQPYGSWPSSVSFTTNTNPYSIYCNYAPTVTAKAAIYSSDGNTLIASTEELTLTTVNDWVTFNFVSSPSLSASTQYVLAVWASSSSVSIYYTTGTAEYFRGSGMYPTWPSSIADQYQYRTYSVYCTYSIP